MTEKHLSKIAKLKTLLMLVLVFMLSFSVLMFVACGDDEETEETSVTYTKVEKDDSDIVNGSFEYGVADVSVDNLPQSSSVMGWGSVSTENSSTSSSVSSGIISVEDAAWEKLVKKLYNDNESKIKRAFNIIDLTNEKTDEEIIDELKTKNPKTHSDATGNKIYMLNTYVSDSNDYWGTAATVTASSSITLKKGTYGKITFLVYTQYASDNGYKVNFRLKNTLNGNTQAQYVLSGIGTQEWQPYTIYVKADENFDSTLTPVLSIGCTPIKNDVQYQSEGTAFFDDIVYTESNETEFNDATLKTPLEYGSKVYDNNQTAAEGVYKYAYDMTLKTPNGYFKDKVNGGDLTDLASDLTKDYYFTGKTETSEKKFKDSRKGDITIQNKDIEDNYIKFENLTNASVSLKLKNDSFLKVDKASYLLISFDIENNLKKPGSTDITFLVYDEEGNENNVVTYNKDDKTTKGYISILNNDHDATAPESRTFYIVIVIGPTDVKGTSSMYDFASGSVTLSNFQFATGKIYQYKKYGIDTIHTETSDPYYYDEASDPNYSFGNIAHNPDKIETENYKFYSLFSSVAASVSIDNHHHENADSYYLSASKSSGSGIYSYPVAIVNYKGVSYDSVFVNKDSDDKTYNDRTENNDTSKSIAGLINSKAANESKYGDDIKNALNYSGEKSIQPIMIYNASEDSYGFLGNAFTIAASSYAAISVKVRVVGNAKANVYLVNAADEDKSVYTISFTGNVKGNSYEETFSEQLAFTNIKDTSSESNGWKTITFYIATGATELNLRLELWNGSRDGADKSQGYVFFAFDAFSDDETFTPSTLSSAFTEPTTADAAFSDSGNPLYGDNALRDNNLKYQRELDATEIKYNKEYTDNTVEYKPNYVWAKSDNVLYAVYNTIDPVAVDPYAAEEEEEEESGCAAERDPSTFWLSFSSILLGVALLLALIMLIVKNVYRRRKSNKNDAKSHYVVSSRTSAKKKAEKTAKPVEKISGFDGYEDNVKEDIETTETDTVETEKPEEQSDEYVYGEVLDFGESEKVDTVDNSAENTESTDDVVPTENAQEENSAEPIEKAAEDNSDDNKTE